MNHFLPDEQYHRLVSALLTLKPCPATGNPEAYRVHEALGEIGGVWPAAIEEMSVDGRISANPSPKTL